MTPINKKLLGSFGEAQRPINHEIRIPTLNCRYEKGHFYHEGTTRQSRVDAGDAPPIIASGVT